MQLTCCCRSSSFLSNFSNLKLLLLYSSLSHFLLQNRLAKDLSRRCPVVLVHKSILSWRLRNKVMWLLALRRLWGRFLRRRFPIESAGLAHTFTKPQTLAQGTSVSRSKFIPFLFRTSLFSIWPLWFIVSDLFLLPSRTFLKTVAIISRFDTSSLRGKEGKCCFHCFPLKAQNVLPSLWNCGKLSDERVISKLLNRPRRRVSVYPTFSIFWKVKDLVNSNFIGKLWGLSLIHTWKI